MTTTQMVSPKTFRIVGFILLGGGFLCYFMATRDVQFTIATNQITYRPIVAEDLMLKPSLKSTTNKPPESSGLKSPMNLFDVSSVNKTLNSELKPEVAKQSEVKIRTFAPVHSLTMAQDPTKNQTILSNDKIVIIVAYMRTGSTLTASLLQEYPKTFYVFEPIRYIMDIYKQIHSKNKTTMTLEYLHSKPWVVNKSDENDVILQEINSWLTCDLDSISTGSLSDPFHKYYTKIMKEFYFCYNGYSSRMLVQRSDPNMQPRLRKYYTNKQNIDACLKNVINKCKSTPLRVLKFIRLRMRFILDLLPLYPNMKIIHLVRDPRGILNSRIKVKAVDTEYLNTAKGLCDNTNNNLKYTKQILKSYPNRLKILHYESLAEHPMEVAAEIAKFSEVNFTKSMQNFIRLQTSSSRDACDYCTQRKNSSLTAYKWRNQLLAERANLVYNMCKKSNEVFGYLPFNSSKEQHDFDKPARKIVDSAALLLSSDNY
ncbi:hypothetical protein ACF0H5_008138 [Mactra antiquata]